MSGSPKRTIMPTPRCSRLSSIDSIGTPTLGSPSVSRGPSTRTVIDSETFESAGTTEPQFALARRLRQPGHDECKNYLFWYDTIPNASAVLWRREILERGWGTHQFAIVRRLDGLCQCPALSDIAFVSTPLNYFRQHRVNVRTRALRDGSPLDPGVQQMLIDRYGMGYLLRDREKILALYVIDLIAQEYRRTTKCRPRCHELPVWFRPHSSQGVQVGPEDPLLGADGRPRTSGHAWAGASKLKNAVAARGKQECIH